MKYKKYFHIEEQNISLEVDAINDAEADDLFDKKLQEINIKHTSEIYKRNDNNE